MTASWISSIFDETKPAYATQAAGLTNAKFQQFTGLAAHMYKKFLSILDDADIHFYVFAGTMIGYVRNGRTSDWIDDIDVIIFEDEIEKFEHQALPMLMAAGFHCFTPGNFVGGGYHLVALSEPRTWNADIPLSGTVTTRVPLAQVDMFYTTVNSDGLLRNPGGWGDYHRHDIPESWVKPPREIEFLGRKVRVFQKYEEDIRKEYGDVMNNIIVASHGNVALNLPNKPWLEFSKEYDDYASKAKRLCDVFPTYEPVANARLTITEDTPLDTLFETIVEQKISHLTFDDTRTVLWAMDLKETFPKLEITAYAQTPQHCARLAHLADFIDAIEVSEPNLETLISGYLTALGNKNPISVRASETNI